LVHHKAVDVLISEDLHHPSLLMNLSLNVSTVKSFSNKNFKRWNFRKADFHMLYKKIASTEWSFLEDCTNVDIACSLFYNKFNNLLDTCVPETCSGYNGCYPPWFNSSIIKNIKRKWQIWRQYKINNNPVTCQIFKTIRSQIKHDIKQAYKVYIDSIEGSIRTDPKKFWSHVNSIKNSKGVPGRMSYLNNQFQDPNDIVNAFADFFQQCYTASGVFTGRDVIHSDANNVNTPFISKSDVTSALKKLKPKLTAGPDNIPAFLLKDCASVLAYPLQLVFNLALKTCRFPEIWKLSSISPIFKKGNRTQVENYRPISLICNFSKVFESILYDTLFASVRNTISEFQHGFVSGRSTVTNLCSFTQFVAECFDARLQVDVVYTDFSKAFDRLDHRILLCKLREFGLSESLLQFFESYLGSRKQFVMCNGFRSKEITVSSGVPQGSVLGPLFFIMFINDISVNIESNILMYADDLKVYRKISNTHDCEMLQRDIVRIQEWCNCNNLFLNVQKCHAMSYTNKSTTILFDYHIDHYLLTRDNMICDLGITFDTRLTFSNHINVIVSGALRSLGFIIRCTKNFSDIRSLKMLYFAFVRSRLEYGSIIWSSNCQTHIQNLEKVQRRFLKFLAHRIDGTYPERGRSQSELLERFECQDLKTRRVNASMSFLRNLIHYRIDCSNLLSKLYFLVPRLTSRNHVCFYLPTPRIDVQKHSPLYTMCENYNVHQHAFDIFR
jgi:hypothetical protein